jgi:hypothetical protein
MMRHPGELALVFDADTRSDVGLALVLLSGCLSNLDEGEIAKVGLRMCAEASGWLTTADVDAALDRLGHHEEVLRWLIDHLRTVGELRREMDL